MFVLHSALLSLSWLAVLPAMVVCFVATVSSELVVSRGLVPVVELSVVSSVIRVFSLSDAVLASPSVPILIAVLSALLDVPDPLSASCG